MSNIKTKCPLWGTDSVTYHTPLGSSTDMYRHINSPRAGGYYNISIAIEDGYKKELKDPDVRRRLSYWIWKENMEKAIDDQFPFNSCPTIGNKTIDEIKQWPILPIDKRIESVALELFKASNGMLNVDFGFTGNYTRGHLLSLSATDEVLLIQAASYCRDDDEFLYLVDRMEEKGILKSHGRCRFLLTLGGHKLAEEAQHKYSPSDQAFVAMWFDKSMNDIYKKAIEPAIECAGYHPYRIDRAEHNNKIDDEIIAEIRRSRFIVADFTHDNQEGVRGGVYYEAGFAHGFNIPVIFTCCKKLQDKIHFDTRQFNHIFWDSAEDLKKQLIDRIGATIGQGPVRKDNGASS